MGTTPISTLAVSVINRLEEADPPIFWDLSSELYSGLVEAMCDLLLLVGRPNITATIPFTCAANTVWQAIPKGVFLISGIQGQAGRLRKVSLFEMDYTQASWGSDWENDLAGFPVRWFPVGLTRFGIYPAVSTPITLTLTGIAYPVTTPWPYDGSQLVPYHDEFFQALEMYASHYCRIKETGLEFEESLVLFQQYMKLAERMTEIEDKRDPLLFSKVWGGPAGLNSITKR